MTRTVEARIVALARFRDRIIIIISLLVVAAVIAGAANAVGALRAENDRLRSDRITEHEALHVDLNRIRAALEGLQDDTTTAAALDRLAAVVDALRPPGALPVPAPMTQAPAASPTTSPPLVPTTVSPQQPCLTPTQLLGIPLPCLIR